MYYDIEYQTRFEIPADWYLVVLQRHTNSKYQAMFQYPAGRKLGSYRAIITANDSEYIARIEYPSDW